MEISDEVKRAYRKARHWQTIDYVPSANARNATNKEVYLLLADALRDTLARAFKAEWSARQKSDEDKMSAWTFADWQKVADEELGQ